MKANNTKSKIFPTQCCWKKRYLRYHPDTQTNWRKERTKNKEVRGQAKRNLNAVIRNSRMAWTIMTLLLKSWICTFVQEKIPSSSYKYLRRTVSVISAEKYIEICYLKNRFRLRERLDSQINDFSLAFWRLLNVLTPNYEISFYKSYSVTFDGIITLLPGLKTPKYLLDFKIQYYIFGF